MNKNKNEPFYIECKMIGVEIDYTLRPKDKHFSSFLSDVFIIKTRVTDSGTKNIKVDEGIALKIFVEPVVDYKMAEPESFGTFNKSRKQRGCFVSVPNNFPERLGFILQQGKVPHFTLRCETGDYSTMYLKSFSMKSDEDMWSDLA